MQITAKLANIALTENGQTSNIFCFSNSLQIFHQNVKMYIGCENMTMSYSYQELF